MYELKKTLPILKPPVASFPNLADALAIILNLQYGYEWFCNNCIQLFGYFEDGSHPLTRGKISFPLNFGWLRYDSIPFFSPVQKLRREYIEQHYVSFTEFVIESISSGYYLHFDYDRYYLPECKEYYRKSHFCNELLVFGYDSERRRFEAADFINDIYSFELLDFSDLENAYHHSERYPPVSGRAVSMIKPISVKHTIDPERIRSLVLDYLESKNSVLLDSNLIQDTQPRTVFGLQNYDLLEQFNELVIERRASLDVRPYHVLYDHNVAMALRLEHMRKKKLIRNSEVVIDIFRALARDCLINRNLVIKYLMTSNTSILKRVFSSIKETKEKERIAFSRAYDAIGKK